MSTKRIAWEKVAPNVNKAMWSLEKANEESSLPKLLLELVRIRASQINNCAFCLDMHTRAALKEGEDDRRLHVVSAWRECDLFDKREQAALLWTETLTLVANGGVPDEVYEQVSSQLTEQELAELTLSVVTINAWNRFEVSFQKQLPKI